MIHAINASSSASINTTLSQPLLISALDSLTACFKGLSPAEDDELFETSESEESVAERTEGTRIAKSDERIIALRMRIEQAVSGIVAVWNGDGEIADVSRRDWLVVLLPICPTFPALQLLPATVQVPVLPSFDILREGIKQYNSS